MRSVQFSIEFGSRRCLATLTCSKPYGPSSMTGMAGLSLLVKPPCGSVDHCIGVRAQLRSGSDEIVAHADLVAVADHRRARQREHQAVGELEPPAVAAEHRREPAANAAIVELHVLVGTEALEHRLSRCSLVSRPRSSSSWLRRNRPHCAVAGRGLVAFSAFASGRAVGGGQRVEQMLVDLEVEHHVHAVAVVAEIFHVGFRQHIGFGEDDGVALAPLQEFAERAQHVVLLDRLLDLGALGRDDERHRVHAEAGDAELDPEAHDLEDLGLHLRVRGVEVGLEIVEAVEVPGLRRPCRASRSISARRETPCPCWHWPASCRTRHTSRDRANSGRAALP